MRGKHVLAERGDGPGRRNLEQGVPGRELRAEPGGFIENRAPAPILERARSNAGATPTCRRQGKL